jgi:hypothetical protein
MEDETPHDELVRLLKAQLKARRDEVFGGLSHAEQAGYNRRSERIRELEEGMNKKPRPEDRGSSNTLRVTKRSA